MTTAITPALLQERGVRVLTRPSGPVVLANLGQNDEAFRRAVTAWLDTPDGRVWLASRGTP